MYCFRQNAVDAKGKTVLTIACESGNIGAVQILLDREADTKHYRVFLDGTAHVGRTKNKS
jgi:hypothetical protein